MCASQKVAYLPESSDDAPVVALRPDSSLLTGGRPFFVPDQLGRIVSETALVARISRLGKAIPERFAHRYYDALTMGIVFTAADVQEQLQQEGLPSDWATCFDGSVAIGEWVANGAAVKAVDVALAYVSQTMTLKTGDLLVMVSTSEPQDVHIGDHVEGWMEDRKVVEFNCK